MKKFKQVGNGWCQCGGNSCDAVFDCRGKGYFYTYSGNDTGGDLVTCPNWSKEKPLEDEDVDRINTLESMAKQLEEQVSQIEKNTPNVPMLNSTSRELKVQINILKKEILRIRTKS